MNEINRLKQENESLRETMGQILKKLEQEENLSAKQLNS